MWTESGLQQNLRSHLWGESGKTAFTPFFILGRKFFVEMVIQNADLYDLSKKVGYTLPFC